MANGHGGYRQPAQAAPVSGPGSLSGRTDGQLAQPGSGQRVNTSRSQASTPGAGPGADPLAQIVGLGEPSTQPGVPVTDGAALGAGAGLDVLGLPGESMADLLKADLDNVRPGMVNSMIAASQRPGATPSLKRFVKRVLANL